MSCCLDFETQKSTIENVIKQYHTDYKIFVPRRIATGGIEYKIIVGIVVLPDVDKNTQLFESLIKLQGRTDVCVKVLDSQIDQRDARIVDLFLLEIEAQIQIGV